jgi:UDP-N-acetylglucosamine acyltransferase
MPQVHSTATVAPEAQLGDGVQIGPGCVLSGRIKLGAGVRLIGNCYISGPVEIGAETHVYPFACIGFPPQDVKFKLGDPTAGVVIGSKCQIREHVTVHAASKPDVPTQVGDRAFLMVNSHVGHDARAGNDVVLVNNSALGGHSHVDDGAILSGGALVHQFTRVGKLAFVSGAVADAMDVPPYCMMVERNRLVGINLVGMRRAGIPRAEITEVRRAFRDVFRVSLPRAEMLAILGDRAATSPAIAEMAGFVAGSKRGIAPGYGRPPRMVLTWTRLLRRGKARFEFGNDDEAEA